MEALSPSDPCETVILKWSSQVGKTEVLNNAVGYVIDRDPGPCLVIQPNVKPMGEAWSKDRLAPMLRDTPALRGKLSESNKLQSDNTILHKKFPGGHLTVGGANSPAGLASRPIRYLFCDEIDRYEKTKEGSSIKLARKRTATFWNRKVLYVSSPTYPGVGIDAEYDGAEQQFEWRLTCEHCGETQFPCFRHFEFDSKTVRRTGKVEYVCEACGGIHDSDHEYRIKRSGQWVQVKDEGWRSKAYWMNQFGSPFVRWADTIIEFLDAKDDPEKLQTVTNTAFAEVWRTDGDGISENALFDRRERYPADVPAGGLVLVCAVDVQGDRLELEVVAFGEGEESWGVEQRVIYGDPSERDAATGRLGRVWRDLDGVLDLTYTHESGVELKIEGMVIDSGGHSTQEVYEYVKARSTRRVFAIKGANDIAKPIVSAPSEAKIARTGQKVKLHSVGVGRAKEIIYQRLQLELGEGGEPPAGYCHFPESYPFEYFEQIAAEELREARRRGVLVRYWHQKRKRNEALDLRVYALWLIRLLNPAWSQWREHIEQQRHAAGGAPSRARGRRVLSRGIG